MSGTVFLIDLDNTLFDHDAFKKELGNWLSRQGDACAGPGPFWDLYEEIRSTTGIVDIPLTVERYSARHAGPVFAEAFHQFVWEFPYDRLIYPGALRALESLAALGRAAVVCDGSPLHQSHKARVSGVAERVGHRIHVFGHKEHHIPEILATYPADGYVLVDDKPRIHLAFKDALGDAITTVLVDQGRYAAAAGDAPPGVDLRVPAVRCIPALLPASLEGIHRGPG